RRPSPADLHGLEIARSMEYAVGESLFMGECVQHPFFDRFLGHEIDDGDGASLVFAPGSGNALFEPGRIPWQVTVDDHTGVLEIQAGASAIGAEEDAAGGIR